MNYLEFKEKILNYFEDLPEYRVDQTIGEYSEECGCCVGSHLSYLFEIGMGDGYYGYGEEFFFRKILNFLGIDERNTRRFFAKASPYSGIFMFGTNSWNKSPYQILKKMFYLMDGEKDA